MFRNMDTYEVGRHAAGSIPHKDKLTPYGLISVIPLGINERTRDIEIKRQIAKIGSRANTMPLEALAHIVDRHPQKFDEAAQELYNRLLVPVDSDEVFHLIYTTKRAGQEVLIDFAVAVTSGYPLGNSPLMVVYSNCLPVVAVSADTVTCKIVKSANELEVLNGLIAAQLKDVFDKVEPPFFIFEDGTLFPLAVKTAQIFSGGLERRLDS